MPLTQKTDNKKKIVSFLFRLFLFACLSSFLVIVVLVSRKGVREELREGDVALKTIYAPTDLEYQGPIDAVKTREAKQEALRKVHEVYSRQKFILPSDALNNLPQDLKSNREKIQAIESAYTAVFANNFFSTPEDKKHLLESNAGYITLIDAQDASFKEVPISDIKTVQDAREEITKTLSKEPFEKKDKEIILALISTSIRPNITLDAEKTVKKKADAENLVAPIFHKLHVKKNELLIDKGQVVTKLHLKKLNSLYAQLPRAAGASFYIGISILVIIFIIITASFLRVYYPRVYFSNRELSLLSALLLLSVILVKAFELSPYSIFIAPVAAFPMAYFMLTGNSAVSFLFAALLSVVMGITFSSDIGLLIMFFIGSIIGIIAVSKVRRRSQILQAGFLVGAVQFIGILAWGLFNNLDYNVALSQANFGIANGIACAAVLMMILPILENVFSLVTNVRLLELSDFNQPILKEMVLKAPGTYHHSLLVGNLSEAAAESIGANSLLARVGAYFHDIGKIEKSEYFSENQMDKESKHDYLNPSMSKLVIMNHVKEGLELAHKYKLKKPIIDFITQHHGTSLVYYFYRRALEDQVETEDINEEVYRYPGPKPQTKETAICLLADSAEAAIRSIEEPTPSKVGEAVHKIINNKFIDGQLDECDLKLKDLEIIAQVFTRILTSIYHTRIVYPEKKNGNHYKEQTKNSTDTKRDGKENSRKDSF